MVVAVIRFWQVAQHDLRRGRSGVVNLPEEPRGQPHDELGLNLGGALLLGDKPLMIRVEARVLGVRYRAPAEQHVVVRLAHGLRVQDDHIGVFQGVELAPVRREVTTRNSVRQGVQLHW